MDILSFDVESNGLHGQGFAIGAILTNDYGTVTEFTARCPIDGPVDLWVLENVLPALDDMQETHTSYESMLDDFYVFLRRHSKDAKTLTFIPWPVETRVLSDIFSSDVDRWFEGPFPLTDLSTALDTLGFHATSDSDYMRNHNLIVEFNGTGHHPLYDAYVADVIYRHLMSSK